MSYIYRSSVYAGGFRLPLYGVTCHRDVQSGRYSYRCISTL
ncbi:MAG: hypothetical protein PF904_04960 [Kiritimatiellae bacterium]|nr:hypothetical protein [Kiritimatiellia bacterium]